VNVPSIYQIPRNPQRFSNSCYTMNWRIFMDSLEFDRRMTHCSILSPFSLTNCVGSVYKIQKNFINYTISGLSVVIKFDKKKWKSEASIFTLTYQSRALFFGSWESLPKTTLGKHLFRQSLWERLHFVKSLRKTSQSRCFPSVISLQSWTSLKWETSRRFNLEASEINGSVPRRLHGGVQVRLH